MATLVQPPAAQTGFGKLVAFQQQSAREVSHKRHHAEYAHEQQSQQLLGRVSVQVPASGVSH